MLGHTGPNEWGLIIDSQSGVRPATNYGTSITSGEAAYGSYTEIIHGSSVTDDAYGILINANSLGANATNTEMQLTIGLDASGGTSFTDFITGLIVSCASAYISGSPGMAAGVYYYFPVFIKAGTSIGAKAAAQVVTPTVRVFVRLFCKPSRPNAIRVGSKVTTYGGGSILVNAGTAITPGTTSDGSYVDLATLGANERPWWFQFGLGSTNTAVASTEVLHCDLAVGQSGSKKIVIQDHPIMVNSNEVITNPLPNQTCFAYAAPGEHIYVRAQGSGAAITGLSMAAYGVS